MVRRLTLALVLAALVLAVSPVAVQDPPSPPARPADIQPSIELPADLARVLRDYEKMWGSRDAAGLARLFTGDGYVLPNGGAPVKGRAAIERHYTGSGGPLFLRAFAYATDGAVGYILGGYASDNGAPDIGKFTLTLRKAADGKWLIVSDMDSPNRRPAR